MDAKQEAPKPEKLCGNKNGIFRCNQPKGHPGDHIDSHSISGGHAGWSQKPGLWSKLGNAVGEAIGTWFAGRQ